MLLSNFCGLRQNWKVLKLAKRLFNQVLQEEAEGCPSKYLTLYWMRTQMFRGNGGQ
jgi:hypothetical protein